MLGVEYNLSNINTKDEHNEYNPNPPQNTIPQQKHKTLASSKQHTQSP